MLDLFAERKEDINSNGNINNREYGNIALESLREVGSFKDNKNFYKLTCPHSVTRFTSHILPNQPISHLNQKFSKFKPEILMVSYTDTLHSRMSLIFLLDMLRMKK